MKFKLLILLLALAIAAFTPAAQAIEAVASFGKLDGSVQVLRESRKIPGREGLILNDQDVVVTGKDSKVTIIFRDGSEIRLFQDTRFVIEKAEESAEGQRRFFYNFKLKVGSFWGRFTKGNQTTSIETPSATIGIKGTNLAVTQTAEKLDIALSEGKIGLRNEDHAYELDAGYRLQGVTKNGTLEDKKTEMPYRITIKADDPKLVIPEPGDLTELYFTLQLLDVKSRQNLQRPGKVYISLDNDKFEFPREIELNHRGYARVKAIIKPFQTADYKDGQLTIYAVMDGEQAMEVGAGETQLTYDIPKKIMRTIRVDMSSGRFTE